MTEIILKEESYKLIGICMEVHRELGPGFSEVIYKDAIEIELQRLNIPYIREKLYEVPYKGTILRHKYKADFIVYDAIVLEAKATSSIVNRFINIVINFKTGHNCKFWRAII